MPIDSGIQLKEGNFTFPSNFKSRVDTKSFEEIPRRFDICNQGIEALGDLFYEVDVEHKESVTVQKAIWENVQERILKVGVFNASSTCTNLANQVLPMRISLPQDRQHFPIDNALVKEPTNPFHETKKFARELFNIVAAVKTLREEELFQYPDFHLFPSRESFVVTESDTGDRYISAGIYSIIPADVEESVSTEELTVLAVKDIIQDRWDKREFRKVLKANDLDSVFQALRHLSRDIPPLEMFAIKTGYASVYGLVGFVIFSVLMFLAGLVVNKPKLDKITVQVTSEDGKVIAKNYRLLDKYGENITKDYKIVGLDGEEVVFVPHMDKKGDEKKENSNYRLVARADNAPVTKEFSIVPVKVFMDVDGNTKKQLDVKGTYRAPMRLANVGLAALDRLYRLDYDMTLKSGVFKVKTDIEKEKSTLNTIELRMLNKDGESVPVGYRLISKEGQDITKDYRLIGRENEPTLHVSKTLGEYGEINSQYYRLMNGEGEVQNLEYQMAPIRIVMNVDEETDREIQVVGSYRAPLKLQGQGVEKLERPYEVEYERPLHNDYIVIDKKDARNKIKGNLFGKEDNTSYSFRLKGLKQWGRQRFVITSKTENKGDDDDDDRRRNDDEDSMPALQVEALVLKPNWELSTNLQEISFQRAEAAKENIEQELVIYAGGPKEENEGEEQLVTGQSYFSVSFPTNLEQAPPPVTIQYLQGENTVVATMQFNNFLSLAKEKKQIAISPQYEILQEEESAEDNRRDKRRGKRRGRKKRRDIEEIDASTQVDTFCIGNQVYYHLPRIPQGMTITNIKVAVPANRLPKQDVTGNLHIAVPGIPKPKTIEIVFRPEQEVEFLLVKSDNSNITQVKDKEEKDKIKKGEFQLEHMRYEVTGFVYPLLLQKGLWTQWGPVQPFEFSQFDFEVSYRGSDADLKGAATLGMRLDTDPDTIYIYDPKTDSTVSIDEFTGSEGIEVTQSKSNTEEENKETQKIKAKIKYFDLDIEKKKASQYFVTSKDKKRISVRGTIAKASNQFYLVVLTEKKIEDTTLMVRWKGSDKELLKLHVSARSEENLRVVQFKQKVEEGGLKKYQLSDCLSLQKTPAKIEGALAQLRYRAILFSGKEADQEVSRDVYLHISDPNALNCLYQTSDDDWFAYMEQAIPDIKVMKLNKDKKNLTQVKLLKLHEDSEKVKKAMKKRQFETKNFFCPNQEVIGQVKQYLFVPGPGVKPGDKEKDVQVTFFYPKKNKVDTVNLKVSWPAQRQIKWNVKFEEQGLRATIYNYPKTKSAVLAKKLRLLTTNTGIALLHEKYRPAGEKNKEAVKVQTDAYDSRLAQTIKWSLEGVNPHLDAKIAKPKLSSNALGKLGEELNASLRENDETGMKIAYQVMREALLLAWSPQAQAILNHHLAMKNLENELAHAQKVEKDSYQLQVKLDDERLFPPLVDEPARFAEITFFVPYNKLMMDQDAAKIYRLREAYYGGIPKSFQDAKDISGLLTELYPYSENLPQQTKILEKSGVHVSDAYLYQNLLRDSLWEARLEEINKTESKFWVAMLATSPQIANINGGINPDYVGEIASLVQKQLQGYFLTPISIQMVEWNDKRLESKISDKEGAKDIDIEKNRNVISATEEQSGVMRFVERSMMAQLPQNTNGWYGSFRIVIDRMTLDRMPFHKYIYLKSYRPNTDGTEAEPVKVRLFKRDGLTLAPYPGQDYGVKIYQDSNYNNANHIVEVSGISVYQDWFIPHQVKTVGEDVQQDRLRIKLYYDEGSSTVQLMRAGGIAPPMLDFETHPASVLLFEVTGYQVSPDRLRQLMRNKKFETLVTRGEKDEAKEWKWNFIFENGPVLVPSAYYIDAKPIVTTYHPYKLQWKPIPAPSEEKRNLADLSKNYKMEFIYVDRNVALPKNLFFPYHGGLKEMCDHYDKNNISTSRMVDMLEKLFKYHDEIDAVKVKFEWNQELTKHYQKTYDAKKQMFSYNYNNGHQMTIMIPELEKFELPKTYKGSPETHPKLLAPARKDMAIIWRITPVSGAQRGFPKYIMQKEFFQSSEPNFAKD